MKVTIYSTPTCGLCQLAKDILDARGIIFNEIDVLMDQKEAKYIVEKTGEIGVPIIVVSRKAEEEIIVGFDQERLMSL